MTEQKNVGGRPREHDREQIAKDMVEWAKLPDSINLCGFCCSREPPLNPRRIADWAKECDNFRGAYETAKAFLGNRREHLLNAELLHVKAYDLNAKTYDMFLDEKVKEHSAYESSLRKDEDSKKETTVNVKVSADGLGRGIKVSAEGIPVTNNRSSKHRD